MSGSFTFVGEQQDIRVGTELAYFKDTVLHCQTHGQGRKSQNHWLRLKILLDSSTPIESIESVEEVRAVLSGSCGRVRR